MPDVSLLAAANGIRFQLGVVNAQLIEISFISVRVVIQRFKLRLNSSMMSLFFSIAGGSSGPMNGV